MACFHHFYYSVFTIIRLSLFYHIKVHYTTSSTTEEISYAGQLSYGKRHCSGNIFAQHEKAHLSGQDLCSCFVLILPGIQLMVVASQLQ